MMRPQRTRAANLPHDPVGPFIPEDDNAGRVIFYAVIRTMTTLMKKRGRGKKIDGVGCSNR